MDDSGWEPTVDTGDLARMSREPFKRVSTAAVLWQPGGSCRLNTFRRAAELWTLPPFSPIRAMPAPVRPSPPGSVTDFLDGRSAGVWTGYQDNSYAGYPVQGALYVTDNQGAGWARRAPTGILRMLMAEGYTSEPQLFSQLRLKITPRLIGAYNYFTVLLPDKALRFPEAFSARGLRDPRSGLNPCRPFPSRLAALPKILWLYHK